MNTIATTHERESADADTVNDAVDAIVASNISKAESLLAGVIANTPSEYT